MPQAQKFEGLNLAKNVKGQGGNWTAAAHGGVAVPR